MLDTLKRLLSPEYWAVADPGPIGRSWPLYVTLALCFAAGLVWAAVVLLKDRTRAGAGLRALAWFQVLACSAGFSTVVGRILGWPGWSARAWPFSLAGLALAGAAAYRMRRLVLPDALSGLRILGLGFPAATATQTPSSAQAARGWLGLAAHTLGIGFVLSSRYGLPAWLAPMVLLTILTPQIPQVLRRRPILNALVPLLAAYGSVGVWNVYRLLGISVIGWQGQSFPNPMLSLFYVDAVVLSAVVFTVLCQVRATSALSQNPSSWWRPVVLTILLVTLAWAGMVYFGKRTHGATASDPYAYAQMGVDLSERGTFLHRFSLFQQLPVGIAWAPLQPIGYHIPRNGLGDCPSVWATGASVLLAAGHRLLGEAGLYVTTPFVALLALAAAWWLVREVFRDEPPPVRELTAALTVALTATSPEFVDRLLVPMADAAAQLFTTLTLVLLLRAERLLERDWKKAAVWLALSGLAFGWAYWVRHTQILLAVAAVLGLVLHTRRTKAGPFRVAVLLLVFLSASLVAALPDIAYRWRVFGGPFATETTELPAMGLRFVPSVLGPSLAAALVAGEWGYLFPLLLLGSYRLARRHPRAAAILGSAFAAVLLVHLSYRFLRLRDLISIFPLVNLATAYGAVSIVRASLHVMARAGRTLRLGPLLVPAAVTFWVVLSLALARWAMIDNLWKPGWASFGYMRAEHRAAFDQLTELTPDDAVIGASLNAGAVTLYAGRDAIRPYDSWTEAEWAIFVDAMRAEGRPLYLLDDGDLMAGFIQQESERRPLTPIAELEVPLFSPRQGGKGWLYRLEDAP